MSKVYKDKLASLPKETFLFGPSPVQFLPKMTSALGGKVNIYAKREDCNSGLAYGGNKVRKLEYLVADARAQGCDTLVSVGGVQSNHTRAVTATATACGMKAITIQEKWVPIDPPLYAEVGNILLSRIMGGDVRLNNEDFGIEHKAATQAATKEQVARIARNTAKILDPVLEIPDSAIILDERFHAGIYGIPDDTTIAAIKFAAQTDAMITDPVYEGKSMAGMMALIKEGSIAAGSNVLYIHLGGQPALNAYSSYFPH
ncbi:hypothetical protein CspHIS471_0411090 [Cutaneotrichosporon sp. HIS471]|nr:hypothetical protein CspHIS471_0411090 [Cutaneotrichosporon sp. HIS471]